VVLEDLLADGEAYAAVLMRLGKACSEAVLAQTYGTGDEYDLGLCHGY